MSGCAVMSIPATRVGRIYRCNLGQRFCVSNESTSLNLSQRQVDGFLAARSGGDGESYVEGGNLAIGVFPSSSSSGSKLVMWLIFLSVFGWIFFLAFSF